MTQVGAAIIRDGAGRILICKRGDGGSCAHLWEFPGGKAEQGETLESCTVRECREELGVEIVLEGIRATARHAYPERTVELTFFDAALRSGQVQRRVHEALEWVRPEELVGYAFCPADAGLIRALAEEG